MPLETIEVLDSFGAPLSCSAKNCSGPGPNQLREWLGDSDVLFLTNSRGKPPLVIVDFDTWQRIAQTIPLKTPDGLRMPERPGGNNVVDSDADAIRRALGI